LQNCTLVISRLLRKDESTLVASKVLVLSRLLHKHLSQVEPASSFIDSLRARLMSLRRKILAIIDRHLSNPDTPWRSLVDDMCAFSLTTNATPTDILRHFHNIRLNGIETSLSNEQGSDHSVIRAVKQLISTLRLSQTIFPKRLSDALGRLKDVPLLQNKDIIFLDELDLRMHEPWIAEDLRNYTPWPRHDELREPEARKQLKAWAQQALTSLSTGLTTSLNKIDDFTAVIRLRESVFHILPWNHKGLPGLIVEDVIDKFRTIFTNRLSTILRSKTHSIQSLLSILSTSFETLDKLPTRSLWTDELTSMDASNGASKLKSTIRSYYQGGEALSSSFTTSYDTWCDGIASLAAGIKSLRDDHWDDDDLGEEEFEEIDGDSRRALLAEDDPKVLEDAFAASVTEAMNSLHEGLVDLISQVSASESTEPSLARCIVCLRVIREVTQRPILVHVASSPPFSPAKISPLHCMLGRHVADLALRKYSSALARTVASPSLTIKLLWEGSPALPVQPSVSAYRLLKDLSEGMAERGPDIWAPGAVSAIKREVINGFIEAITRSLDHLTKSTPNEDLKEEKEEEGDSDSGEKEKPKDNSNEDKIKDKDAERQELVQDKASQLLFDVLYLSKAFDSTPSTNSDQKGIINELNRIAILDTTLLLRMDKSAGDYWKRSYLMFAILAS
jgi:conserved oligomeric Golgi complex subunit 1